MEEGENNSGTNSESSAATNAHRIGEETQKNVSRIVAIERELRESSTAERISVAITEFCGSVKFIWVHVIWFGSWVTLNTLFPSIAFDPFPFTFLTLVVSLEAIFLATFILISQNRETRLTERRNNLDLQINLLAEQENTKMLGLLHRIAEKVGVPYDEIEEVFEEDVEPEELVKQIVNTAESGKHGSDGITT